MATGHIDANGVYIFGGSDVASPVHTLLNKGQTATSAALESLGDQITDLHDNRPVRFFTSAAERDAALGIPTTTAQQLALQESGFLVTRRDSPAIERYFGQYHATNNPMGAASPGWYALDYAGLPLPKVTQSPGNYTAVTATKWANFAPVPAIKIKFHKPAIVQLTVAAWLNATEGEIRAGVNLTGATTMLPNEPAWGQSLYYKDSGPNVSQQGSATKTVLVNPGETTFTVQAYRVGTTGVKAMAYVALEVTPLRYA